MHDIQQSHIPQRDVPVCYIMYNSRAPGSHKLERYAQEIRDHTEREVELLDVTSHNGEHTRIFYGIMLEDLPAVLLVRPNHTLAHHWLTPYLPSSRDIAHYFR